MDKLMSCPFCGGTPEVLLDHPQQVTVECTGCLANIIGLPLDFETMEDAKMHAIESWNSRV